MATDALTEAARDAPPDPGVYFFLGDDRTLLYVGKASNLRRRLADHARSQRRRAAFVHWETCADEDAAFAREADLIVLLRPTRNAAHSDQDAHSYVRIAEGGFELTSDVAGPGRTYGSFPHLAKGGSSHTANRTKSGYVALLRLLWAAQAGDAGARIPARIAGHSPPARHQSPLDDALRAPLHDLLTGRSARLIGDLERSIAVPEFMRPGMARDATAARELFRLGPQRLRAVRLRHGLPAGPVAGDVLAAVIASEVRATIGDFRAPAAPAPAHLLGRRETRVRELRETIAGR